MSFLSALASIFNSTNSSGDSDLGDHGRTGSRHHSSAVADGLRLGSSHCGRVMNSWKDDARKTDRRHDDD